MKLTETLKRRIDAFFRNLNDEELEYINEKYFNKPKEAINYTHCCKSDSELLRSSCNWCNGNNKPKSDGVANITDIG